MSVTLYKISASAAKRWDQCPGSWTLRYHYKIPEVIQNASAPNFGSWIHDIFEYAAKMDKYDQQTLQEYAMKSRNKYGTIDRDKIQLTAQCLLNFEEWFGGMRAADCEVVGTEQKFNIDLTGDDHKAFGSIDLVLRHRPTGRLAVIDYKTSKKQSQVRWLTNDVQMLLYATVASMLYDQPIGDISVAHYQPHLNAFTKLTYDEGQKDRFVKKFARRMDTIREKGDVLDFTPNNLCDWCAYKGICPVMDGDPETLQKIIEMGDEALAKRTKMKDFWLQKRKEGIPV